MKSKSLDTNDKFIKLLIKICLDCGISDYKEKIEKFLESEGRNS